MSLKKNSLNSTDKKYLKLAINLASHNKGLTGINPSVGCVVVKDKKIISYGNTNIKGRPHAETITLNKNKKNNNGSSVYLTLEPCSHYGKTPPCTNALIKSKVKKVIFSQIDPDNRSKGKAKKILNKKNIKVHYGLLNNEVKNFYKDYNYSKKHKLPYVIGKIACTNDYFIFKDNTKITNNHSRKVSHLLRFRNQGILTSYKTVNNDNPKLTCRINGLEKFSPIRIIIDRDLKININSYIVRNSNKSNTILFHNSKNLKKINMLNKRGLRLIFFKVQKDNYFNIKDIFKKIYDLDIHTILVECGWNLTQKILLNRYFNEFYLFKGKKPIHKKRKINILKIKKSINSVFKNKTLINTYLDKDKLIHYY